MYSEFSSIGELTGGSFATGNDVLVFYEIDDVDRGNDMIVLVGYCIFCHILACLVLYLRYTIFDGKVQAISGHFQKSLHERMARISEHGAKEDGAEKLEETGGKEVST